MTQLNLNDVNNLLAVLRRTKFEGLDEAEVGVYLKQKLTHIGNELANQDKDEGEKEEA